MAAVAYTSPEYSGAYNDTAAVTGSASAATAPLTDGQTGYTIVAANSQASFRAREQLVGKSLPNDAIGTTRAVSGQVVLNADGSVAAEQSKITVALSSLTSDESRRDQFIKQNTLQTSQYPDAVFTAKSVSGLPAGVPTSGTYDVQLTGDLTIHGVTKPATWSGSVTFDGKTVTGSLTTPIQLTDFGMTSPTVPMVLSIEPSITLAIDFTGQAA
jgi:polyisoprenoid-binding protein YceI